MRHKQVKGQRCYKIYHANTNPKKAGLAVLKQRTSRFKREILAEISLMFFNNNWVKLSKRINNSKYICKQLQSFKVHKAKLKGGISNHKYTQTFQQSSFSIDRTSRQIIRYNAGNMNNQLDFIDILEHCQQQQKTNCFQVQVNYPLRYNKLRHKLSHISTNTKGLKLDKSVL